MLSSMRLCSNVPAQAIVQTALWGNQSVETYVAPEGRVTKQRDFVIDALNSMPGVSVVKSKAAFYCFPKLDPDYFHIKNDMTFAYDLLRDKHVLVVQGTGFNWPEQDHFRIVYLPMLPTLKEAMEKIGDFLTYYHQ